MRRVYFVTEGKTDQIVLEALVAAWLGEEDFIPVPIQPPGSDTFRNMVPQLSEGWKGVLAWCSRPDAADMRTKSLAEADCLIVHMDADVATDSDFKNPPYTGSCPPARPACDWIRNQVLSLFAGHQSSRLVVCVPSKDMEAWVLTALHPDEADRHAPIECRSEPGSLLIDRPPYRLVRRKDGRLRKNAASYRSAASRIADMWGNCTSGATARCPEAHRFEQDVRRVLDLPEQ